MYWPISLLKAAMSKRPLNSNVTIPMLLNQMSMMVSVAKQARRTHRERLHLDERQRRVVLLLAGDALDVHSDDCGGS